MRSWSRSGSSAWICSRIVGRRINVSGEAGLYPSVVPAEPG